MISRSPGRCRLGFSDRKGSTTTDGARCHTHVCADVRTRTWNNTEATPAASDVPGTPIANPINSSKSTKQPCDGDDWCCLTAAAPVQTRSPSCRAWTCLYALCACDSEAVLLLLLLFFIFFFFYGKLAPVVEERELPNPRTRTPTCHRAPCALCTRIVYVYCVPHADSSRTHARRTVCISGFQRVVRGRDRNEPDEMR